MKYFAMIDGEQKGPFELEQIPEAGVRPSTYVWCKGMADWEKAEDVAEICRLFRNRVYDLMHPSSDPIVTSDSNPQQGGTYTDSFSDASTHTPSRFDHYLKDQQAQGLPTLEEIESRENINIPPASMTAYAWIVTFLCFPPTGIAAIIYAKRSKEAWQKGENRLAHDYCNAAKLWTGVSFFIGLIVYAFLIRFL